MVCAVKEPVNAVNAACIMIVKTTKYAKTESASTVTVVLLDARNINAMMGVPTVTAPTFALASMDVANTCTQNVLLAKQMTIVSALTTVFARMDSVKRESASTTAIVKGQKFVNTANANHVNVTRTKSASFAMTR